MHGFASPQSNVALRVASSCTFTVLELPESDRTDNINISGAKTEDTCHATINKQTSEKIHLRHGFRRFQITGSSVHASDCLRGSKYRSLS